MKNISKYVRFLILATSLSLSCQAVALEFAKNFPEKLKALVLSDLGYMYAITGTVASPLHTQIFGKVNGADYKRYFESRITYIVYGDCGSTDGVACFIPMRPTALYINKKYIPGVEPLMARIAVYFSVARFTDTKNALWYPEVCPTPFLDKSGNEIFSRYRHVSMSGVTACDKTPFGAYASTAILLQNISKFCTNCSAQDISDAAELAPLFLERVIATDAHLQMVKDSF